MKFAPNFKKKDRSLRTAERGNKGCAFANHYIPLRAGGAGEGPSHGRLICKQIGPSPGGPLAGEHNPGRSHLHRKSIAYPMSSPEECSAFFGSCSATPADHIASAETCVKSHLKMEFHVFPAPTQSRWSLGNSDRSAHWAGGWALSFVFPFKLCLISARLDFQFRLFSIATV